MARKYRRVQYGNMPNLADGWSYRRSVDGFEIYVKEGTDGWFGVKLTFSGKKHGKANYWLRWNLYEERFAESRDLYLMDPNEPGMRERLERILVEVLNG